MNSHLLLSGSREFPQEQIGTVKAYIHRVIARAKAQNLYVLLGDAPGVDAWVIAECEEQDVPLTVFYPENRPIRHYPEHAKGHMVMSGMSFRQRDHNMIELAESHHAIVLGVWNGQSTGTKEVLDYAKRLNIEQVWVWTPRQSLRKW